MVLILGKMREKKGPRGSDVVLMKGPHGSESDKRAHFRTAGLDVELPRRRRDANGACRAMQGTVALFLHTPACSRLRGGHPRGPVRKSIYAHPPFVAFPELSTFDTSCSRSRGGSCRWRLRQLGPAGPADPAGDDSLCLSITSMSDNATHARLM
jgi:hypothetical protein